MMGTGTWMSRGLPGDFGETTDGYRVDVEKAEHHDGDGMVVVGEGSEQGVVVKGPEHGDVVEGRATLMKGRVEDSLLWREGRLYIRLGLLVIWVLST